jgi:hypothetical protein
MHELQPGFQNSVGRVAIDGLTSMRASSDVE